jgi:hypothetical protein
MRKSYYLLVLLLLTSCSKFDIFSSTPHWKTYQSEALGISLESPFPVEITDTEPDYYAGKVLKIASPNFFVMNFSAYRLEGKNRVVDSKKVYRACLESLKTEDAKKLALKSETATCAGMPATVTGGTYEDESARIHHYSNLFVARGNQYWLVQVIHDHPGKFDKMAERVLQSVKITPKDQGLK